MDTAIANMRGGLARGLVQPRGIMEKVLPQLDAMIVDDVKESPFYRPVANMPEEIAGEDRQRLTRLYENTIRGQIIPAYRRLRDFVRDEYMPGARATTGLSGLPGGEAMYAYFIRTHTNTTLGPDEIMALGRRQMARARERMQALHKASGSSGTLADWSSTASAGTTRR